MLNVLSMSRDDVTVLLWCNLILYVCSWWLCSIFMLNIWHSTVYAFTVFFYTASNGLNINIDFSVKLTLTLMNNILHSHKFIGTLT